MGTLIVTVTPECEGLLHTLPQHEGWDLESEEYSKDGTGIITIGFNGDDLSAAAERALDSNDGVIEYRVIKPGDYYDPLDELAN